jgi:uncharacterized membrane protein YfcA
MAGLDGLLLDLHGAVYIGALCLVLGVCMAVFKWTFLIAGYDDSSIPDRMAGRMVGAFLILVGLVTAGYGVALTQYRPPEWIGLVIAVAVIAGTGQLIYRLNTYES